MAENKPTQLRLRVGRTAESMLRKGHPWLFAESVREQNRDGQLGELAVIFDANNRFLAIGLFDPDSPIRVRILHAGKPQPIDLAWWQSRLEKTFARRNNLFDEQTTGYRYINGENDGWPGLVLDRYDQTLVLKIYTSAWFPRLAEILELIAAQIPNERIVLRLSRNIQEKAEKEFSLADGKILRGASLDEPVIFLESGLRFEADVLRGQKTGFFLDQRENRRRAEALAAGRTVLNAFSFSGGFSVYAARGGATAVASLDLSAHALTAAERNFLLNRENPNVARCRHEIIQADAFEWFQKKPVQRFDLIVLDPPSLAKREAERAEAIRAYSNLMASAIDRLSPEGILVAASCSAHVSSEEFFNLAQQTANKSGRKFEELETTGHAPDHPATFREGKYLKCIFLRFA